MKLCKDFVDGRICLYWSSDTGALLSPMMSTLQDAEEWWKTFQFTQYAGPERRLSIYDRRSDYDKRRRMAEGALGSSGRRSTDKPIHVECDLAAAKITLLSHVGMMPLKSGVFEVVFKS